MLVECSCSVEQRINFFGRQYRIDGFLSIDLYGLETSLHVLRDLAHVFPRIPTQAPMPRILACTWIRYPVALSVVAVYLRDQVHERGPILL